VAGAANQSAIEGTALQQAGNQGFFDALVTGASSFGRSLFQPKGVPNAPSGPLPGGSSQLPFPNPTPMTAGSVGNLVSPRPRKPNQFSGGF
jgi:hypothetical protein